MLGPGAGVTYSLGGGNSNIFYFHHYLGKISHFDEHIFSTGLKPPTSSP